MTAYLGLGIAAVLGAPVAWASSVVLRTLAEQTVGGQVLEAAMVVVAVGLFGLWLVRAATS